ncbi:hypothetical protein FDECE_4827 [Fusarium decemcellulare]|nr:hypothetical protein FDECE_4827 [Fusarium decemcellulare]
MVGMQLDWLRKGMVYGLCTLKLFLSFAPPPSSLLIPSSFVPPSSLTTIIAVPHDTIATNTNKSSEQMEEKIKQQGGKIDALRTEVGTLRAKDKQLRAEVEALQAKIQTLEEANEQRIEEYRQLPAEVETLRARLQISDEDRQLRAQIEEELRCAQMRAAQTTSSVDASNQQANESIWRTTASAAWTSWYR